jgi:hypothetical protein
MREIITAPGLETDMTIRIGTENCPDRCYVHAPGSVALSAAVLMAHVQTPHAILIKTGDGNVITGREGSVSTCQEPCPHAGQIGYALGELFTFLEHNVEVPYDVERDGDL